MKRPFLQMAGSLACLFAVLLANGGHWPVLQSIAWARMLVEYSRDASLSEAVTKTFDGEHPCQMCRNIQEGRKQEQRKAPVVKWQKLPDLLPAARPVSVPAPELREAVLPAYRALLHSDFVFVPPKPPPRHFAV